MSSESLRAQIELIRSTYPANGVRVNHVTGIWSFADTLCRQKFAHPYLTHRFSGPSAQITCQKCRRTMERLHPEITFPWKVAK